MHEPIRIDLKAIKHVPSMSEETNAYTANLYVDDVFVAQVGNDGRGGCDRVVGPGRNRNHRDAIKAYDEACRRVPIEHPHVNLAELGEERRMVPDSLEYMCARIVERHAMLKTMKRQLRRNLVGFTDGLPPDGTKEPLSAWRIDSAAQIGPFEAAIRQKHPSVYILNGRTDDEILAACDRAA